MSRKVLEFATCRVANALVKPKENIKYLGVMVDNRLNFGAPIGYALGKVLRM